MYEQGVIRPPSEASSLLIRVTRNCPWNQCLFCPAYKGVKFSKRTVEEVKMDIDSMADELRGYSGARTAFLQDAEILSYLWTISLPFWIILSRNSQRSTGSQLTPVRAR